MHIRDEKQLVRERIKERALRFTPKERDAESRSICRRIMENLPEGPQTICAYWPMPSEVDIAPLVTDLLEKGHTVFLPCFTRAFFEFRQIESVDDLVTGKFGLKEPPASAPILDLHTVSIVLLPAIGFDRTGNRLGRGNGGYDRWLADLKKVNPTALLWGIAFEHQLTDSVPTETHDQKVDTIMTAHMMIACKK